MTEGSETVAEAFRKEADESVLLDLIAIATDGEATVKSLAQDRDAEVRGWLVHVLPDILAQGSVPQLVAIRILQDIFRGDRDLDNRDSALETLLALDPASTALLIPELRRRMSSEDYYAPVTAMWVLARLDARESVDQIEAYLARTGLERWQGREAKIVLDVLRHDDAAIADQLASHDHDMTYQLCRAAVIRRTETMRTPLALCAETFDDECQKSCSQALQALSST
jgi:hypothetical protein